MNNSEQQSFELNNRQVRVFISSTFRDMHTEREELVKRVFPQLRRLCESRGVTWGEVDLRWGVTEEQKAEGKVLPICLEEIKRCRPYFIGILGERYGWVPREIPSDLIEQEPWLAGHRDHSVTELEIIHGVLRDRSMHGHAFFYFRDHGYVDRLPPGGPRADFACENPEAKTRLDRLKEKIREAQVEQVCALRENFHDAKELGQWILDDLIKLIDRLFPEGSAPDPLDRDALDHEMFAQSRSRVYIGREEYFRTLDDHASAKTQQPLLVIGESGSGKSALLANWALRYRQSHPDDPLIMHFIGATPYSADWAAMVRRTMAELKRRFDLPGDIPGKPDELRLAFANWLHMAAARGKVVLILDGLNQLEDREGGLDLVWLPPVMPENVRFFVSTLPGRPLDELKKRGLVPLEIKPLTIEERRKYVQKYLAQYSKSLSAERLERIAKAPQAQNPLFLKALLEELRLFGSYERLDQWIERYLSAQDAQELYEKILARWEQDYEGDTDLVGDALSRIWASRRGLSESELLEMLGSNGQPLARAVWSPLFLAAGDALVNRSGLITFFHDYLRNAVRDAYMPTETHQKKAHLQVAEYFTGKELGPRKIDELPWQLAEGKEWRSLYELLADLEFFGKAWNKDQFEVKAYWAMVEEQGNLRMVDGYGKVIDKTEGYGDYAWSLGLLLDDTGHPQEAMMLRSFLVEYYRGTGDKSQLSGALGNQALILKARGELDAAMALHKESERICRELGNKDGLQASLGNQAVILKARGELDAAMALHKEKERICRELGNKDSLSASLGNQAGILYARGELDAAIALLKEQERICRELGNKDSLSASLGNQALILADRGELDSAMALYKEQERISRELGNKDSLQISLGSQALILYARGELDAAMTLHKEEEWICRELGNKDSLQRSLGNQANILNVRGELVAAMALYKEQERICRELGNKDDLSVSLGNQALILKARGELDAAMALYKEEERICRELGNKDSLQRSLGNQANILNVRGELVAAMALYKEQERICRELGNRQFLAITLINQASLLGGNQNNPRSALPLADEALQIAQSCGYAALAKQIDGIRQQIIAKMGGRK